MYLLTVINKIIDSILILPLSFHTEFITVKYVNRSVRVIRFNYIRKKPFTYNILFNYKIKRRMSRFETKYDINKRKSLLLSGIR